MARFRLWDLPTRIFHWSLVLCVTAAYVSVKLGGNAMLWHGRCGLAVLGLLAFRLLWGFLGPTYARFAQFVRGPAAIAAYLRGDWRGAGHNPLGALSVLAMLATLLLLSTSGLFANDDIAFEGPLYALAGKELSDRLSGLHRLIEPWLLLLVGLHLGALFWYVRVRRETLIMPMITGFKEGEGEDTRGGGMLPFCIALAFALATVYAASGAWLPPAPAAPAGGSAPAF